MEPGGSPSRTAAGGMRDTPPRRPQDRQVRHRRQAIHAERPLPVRVHMTFLPTLMQHFVHGESFGDSDLEWLLADVAASLPKAKAKVRTRGPRRPVLPEVPLAAAPI